LKILVVSMFNQRAFEVPGYRGDYHGQPADDAPGIIRAP
jgi:hypothetical protein